MGATLRTMVAMRVQGGYERNLIGMTLSDGLGGEKEGAGLGEVCDGAHCEG